MAGYGLLSGREYDAPATRQWWPLAVALCIAGGAVALATAHRILDDHPTVSVSDDNGVIGVYSPHICSPQPVVAHRSTVYVVFTGELSPGTRYEWYLDGHLDTQDLATTSLEPASAGPPLGGGIKTSLTFVPSHVGEVVSVKAFLFSGLSKTLVGNAVGPGTACHVVRS